MIDPFGSFLLLRVIIKLVVYGMKLINKTPNGQIIYCPFHQAFHLEFGNMFVHLSENELMSFKRYVDSIDYNFFLAQNEETANLRKLMLCIGSKHIFFVLHPHELKELRNLLTFKQKSPAELIQNTEVIEHNMIFN